MKVYKSKLNIKFSDYWWKLLLWMIAVVCTLGFAAVLFWLWAMKVVIDHVEVEVHEENNLDKLSSEGSQGGHY
jgi:uncharacterized membrane protein YjgN (DUF898 family)